MAPGRSFLATFALVLLAIAGLSVADTFLAKTERTESLAEAARLFEQGRVLMQSGRNTEAVEPIKDAIAIEPSNRDYLRTLAQAQFATGNALAAETTTKEVLQIDSTDGLANLILARVLVQEGRFTEAVAYFHRAIYGHWNDSQKQNRRHARFELIDLLAQRNSKEELLAELLSVQDDAPGDLKTRTRLAQLFLAAGSPGQADGVFRGILRDAPTDTAARAGLGQAEFARANYRAAQREFEAALRLAPDDQAIRLRLDLCNELLALDPTVRGLSTQERFLRSRQLVELTLNEASQCAGQNASSELQALLDKAANELKTHVNPSLQSETAQSNLDLAEQLWQARKKDCSTPPPADGSLALLLAKLTQ